MWKAKGVSCLPKLGGFRWRSLWRALHLYLGLTIGFVFVIAGITGSLLVFYLELDELINPQLSITEAQSQQPRRSYDALFQAIRAEHPERTGAWRLEVPRKADAMLMARYYKPLEKQHLKFAPLIVWVNPYNAEVVSSRFWGEFIMTWIYDMHYHLLLDRPGKVLMGIVGLLLLIPLITGLVLWWPKMHKWGTALSLKSKSSRARYVYDLHKLNGVYGWLVLTILLITGAVQELPEYVKPMINRLSPIYHAPVVASVPQRGTRINLDQAAAIARNVFPQAQLRWLEIPKGGDGAYRIVLRQPDEPSRRFPKTTIWIDQYSGAVLAVRNPQSQSAGDTFLSWMHPLHSGEMFGLAGRILVFIAGWIPLVLYVTGFMRWRQKASAKRRSAHRNTRLSPANVRKADLEERQNNARRQRSPCIDAGKG